SVPSFTPLRVSNRASTSSINFCPFSDNYGRTDQQLSDKGQKFIDDVDARLETRKGVKDGTDLFPDEANIPEFKPIIKELNKHIEDGNTTSETVEQFKSRTADEVGQSEPIITHLESQANDAASLTDEELQNGIRQAEDLVRVKNQDEPLVEIPQADHDKWNPEKLKKLSDRAKELKEILFK